MRCKGCNVVLDDNESTRKDDDGSFFDLCNECFYSVYEEDDIDLVEIGLAVAAKDNTDV